MSAIPKAKDKRVEIAIRAWSPRFVASGVPLTDFEEVTAGIARWDDWCAAWSARAAAFEKRLKACISLSGPYSWVEIFDSRNELSREAFKVRSHSRTMEEAREKAKTLTLQGVAKNITCPIYIVGGELDHLTPPQNAERIAAEVSGPKVLDIVKGGNHVVNNRRYRYQTQTADWLARQLGLPKV
jgi:2,6-dihydroxypseudooxynicotine hydrolase